MEAALEFGVFLMRITINGKDYCREKLQITYEEVVKQVFGKVPDTPMTVTYHWRGDGDNKRSGIIGLEDSIDVADGMIISAYDTRDA